jgi:hypothetical protein
VGLAARGQGAEAEALRRLLTVTEVELDLCRCEIEQYKRKLKEPERAWTGGTSLKHSLAAIEARMRAVPRDPQLARLSDRELARRTGISPQAVGNWRRRVAVERAAARGRMSSVDRKGRPRARAA